MFIFTSLLFYIIYSLRGPTTPPLISPELNLILQPDTGGIHARSLHSIIRNCATTIFICTWVSVHPNIPPPNQSLSQKIYWRLKHMFVAIIAPELVVAWAMRQWVAARQSVQKFSGKNYSQLSAEVPVLNCFRSQRKAVD